jgi:hypothetical protein
MLKILPVAFLSMVAYGADNPWNKVKELKTGTELRIYKTGAKQPILAMMDEATDDRLVIVVKKEQMAIDKDEIDRIDFRSPKSGGSRVTKDTRTTLDPPGQVAGPAPRGGGSSGGPTTNSSSSVNFGSKPDFETIYRRSSAPPVK